MSAIRGVAWVVLLVAIPAGCVESVGPTFEQPRPLAVGVLQLEGAGTMSTPTWTESGAGGSVPYWTMEPSGALVAPRALLAPAEVMAHEPFEVRVYTIGSNGCWAAEGHVVHQAEGVVEIIPYDAHSDAEICTAVLSFLRHTVTLRLDEPGEWTLRVTGRRARLGNRVWEVPVTGETMVSVR